MTTRFTGGQFIGFLHEADAGLPVKDFCRKRDHGERNYYAWETKPIGMSVSNAQRLESLESENTKLKKLKKLLPLRC